MIKLKNILIETYVPGISDTDIVAATIIGEAGGESFKGMQAIKMCYKIEQTNEVQV